MQAQRQVGISGLAANQKCYHCSCSTQTPALLATHEQNNERCGQAWASL